MKESEVEAALRLKSYIVEEPIPPSVVTSSKLIDRLVQFTERSMPLLKFGWKALK